MSLATLIDLTRAAVTDDPNRAQLLFAAHNTLVGVTEVDVKTGAHSFRVDEPEALGGTDAGANPVQYALASLGSCQAITYRFWAAKLGIELDAVTVRVEGDLDVRGFLGFDDSVRPGFTAVRIDVASPDRKTLSATRNSRRPSMRTARCSISSAMRSRSAARSPVPEAGC